MIEVKKIWNTFIILMIENLGCSNKKSFNVIKVFNHFKTLCKNGK